MIDLGVVAGEASGDLLGAHFIEALKHDHPRLHAAGIAGPRMIETGVAAIYPSEKLAVNGYVEVVRHLPELLWIRSHIGRYFLQERPRVFVGIDAPAPYKQIDLLRVAKAAFRSPSNKLDYVSSALGIGQKVRHEGHELWTKCMDGNAEAWESMERYNKQVVVLLEKLYERFLPWIKSHPNHGAFTEETVCTNCGGENIQRRGYAVTTVMK